MELWQLALLSAAGVVAGFLNVMAGGGSLLTVPIMVFMGIPGAVANGTNRIAILAQNVTAVTTFFRRGFADFKLSLSLAACSLPGAVAGAFVGTRLEGVWFNRALALIMIGVMLIMYFDKGKKSKAAQRRFGTQSQAAHLGSYPDGRRGLLRRLHPARRRLHHHAGATPGDGLSTWCAPTCTRSLLSSPATPLVALVVFASQVEMLWIVGLAYWRLGNSIGGWLGRRVQVKTGRGHHRSWCSTRCWSCLSSSCCFSPDRYICHGTNARHGRNAPAPVP